MGSGRVVRREVIRAFRAPSTGQSSKPDYEYAAVLLDSSRGCAETRRCREFRWNELPGIPFYCGDHRGIERVDVVFGAEVDAVEPDQRSAHTRGPWFSS